MPVSPSETVNIRPLFPMTHDRNVYQTRGKYVYQTKKNKKIIKHTFYYFSQNHTIFLTKSKISELQIKFQAARDALA